MIDDVYSALVALCSVSVACLLIFTILLGVYIFLKIISLYHKIFDKKDNRGKKNVRKY